MAEEKRIYKWYLILSIIYSLISILLEIIFLIPNLLTPDLLLSLGFAWGPIVYIWFMFNIVMLVIIFAEKIEKIALLLPGLYISEQTFLIILAIMMPTFFRIFDLTFSAIILIIAIGLLSRK